MKMKTLYVLMGVFFFLSCSLRDYMNQPVMKDAYDGPMILFLEPMGGYSYPGRVRVVADVSEAVGVESVEVVSEGLSQWFPALNLPVYRLHSEVSFSSPGLKTIEVRAKNRLGIERSVSLAVNILGPSITITNDFAHAGYIYTAANTLSLGGEVFSGLTNVLRVFVRVKRPNSEEEVPAVLMGGFWETMSPVVLNPNEDVVLTALAEDQGGVQASTPPVTVYQDQRGPDPVILTRPMSNGVEANMVFFEGTVKDDKVGAARLVATVDNWVTSFTNELNSWWGNRETVAFAFTRSFPPGIYNLLYYAEDFLGNRSQTNTITFTVDGTLPYVYVTGPLSGFCTNKDSFDVYGEYDNATILQYSLNGGPWQNISSFGGGKWTNLINFIPNQTNTLRLMAISNQYTNLSLLYKFLIDTLPPLVTFYDIGTQPRVNVSSQSRHIKLQDNLSGIAFFYDILDGYWGYGGMGFLSETNLTTWLGPSYEDNGTRDFPFGAVVTNTLILIDRAGNTNINFSRVAQVYPAIFVSPGGSPAAFGVASAPITLAEGMETAKALGVRTLVLQEGTYNLGLLSQPLRPQNNMMIVGGFDNTFTNHASYSTLKNTGKRIMELVDVSSVFLSYLHFSGSGSSVTNGVLWVTNSSVFLVDNIFSSNQGKQGAAIYAVHSQLGLVSNLFTRNRVHDFGVVVGVGSFYFGLGNSYLTNISQTISILNRDVQLCLLGGAAIISNEVFSSYSNAGNVDNILINVYAKDMGTFLLHDCTFTSVIGSTNGVHLWLAGNMQNTSILSNHFKQGVQYGMIKEGNWGGYELRQNSLFTNGLPILWAEFLPAATNLIFSNEITKFNDPGVTRATPDSTDNQALP
ncbi:hypothetical protein [Thermospira aquatica]|uniref:Right handed beta helix domain-containing protein n=1 Tax=Thermospira aquatica TaxID=2828656 RepID=A0AAX3BBK8_9SPIR|nr:hypothetical protein [Thermospira aquatica]URA09666.1 hypothetical protein KDW03_09270 [Thermospira aquatica]